MPKNNIYYTQGAVFFERICHAVKLSTSAVVQLLFVLTVVSPTVRFCLYRGFILAITVRVHGLRIVVLIQVVTRDPLPCDDYSTIGVVADKEVVLRE